MWFSGPVTAAARWQRNSPCSAARSRWLIIPSSRTASPRSEKPAASRWKAGSIIFPAGVASISRACRALRTDASVIAGADVLIVVVPGQHHDKVIRTALPYLRRGQLVLLNPGGVGGALVWGKALAQAEVRGVLLAQPSDLLYAGSRTPSSKVLVNGKKKKAALGVFPNRDHAAVFEILADVFPEFEAAHNALVAGLGGPGMLVHPLPMLMNATRIDREAPFRYDAYDITRSIARAIERLDAERTAIIAELGGQPTPIKDVLTEYYGVTGADFHETVLKVPAYQGSTAPPDFNAPLYRRGGPDAFGSFRRDRPWSRPRCARHGGHRNACGRRHRERLRARGMDGGAPWSRRP